MSKEDIDRAVSESEKYAAEDKKRREEVDARNHADQLVYQTEKTLGELGDKLSAEDKSSIQSACDSLKEALKGTDIELIKAKTEDLTKVFYAASEKLYQQSGAQGAQGAQGQTGYDAQGGANNGGAQNGGADYYDADYKVVDDDDKK